MRSNTGLMESLRKPIEIVNNVRVVELSCLTSPAPFVLRPFAGLYNPFSPGCSILCNHPADAEIKDVVRRAKDSLITESKIDNLAEEMAALRHQQLGKQAAAEAAADFVPEELFRRYTETDSRPLTPAPTLASAVSRGSLRRRCLTPDQPPAPRQALVLDLRRSHSQETLCWHGMHASELSSAAASTLHAPPVASMQPPAPGHVPLVAPVTLSRRSPYLRGNLSDRGSQQAKSQLRVLQAKNPPAKVEKPMKPAAHCDVDELLEEDALEMLAPGMAEGGDSPRRRGRRRKGRGRLLSAALIAAVQNDPETQIAGIGSESHNPSSRGSVAPPEEPEGTLASARGATEGAAPPSFLAPSLLQHLHREADVPAVESEFDPKRRCVLEEALRTRPEKTPGPEMLALLKELRLPPVSLTRWLHLPRVFSRRNAAFSLPIDRRLLDGLLPMQYISEYVKVSRSKQLLYRTVLQKFHPDSFYISLQSLEDALCVMMGEGLSHEAAAAFAKLVGWDQLTVGQLRELAKGGSNMAEALPSKTATGSLFAEYDVEPEIKQEEEPDQDGIHFRTWCGLCALCERLNATFPTLHLDPPHEVEVADFDTLEGKLMSQKADKNLSSILTAIQNTHLESE